MNKGPQETEISRYIRKVDWSQTPDAERLAFSHSFINLELATLTSMQAETAARSRVSSLIITLIAVLVFSFFGLEPVGIIMIALGTQALLFLLSQIFENSSKKILRGLEEVTLENVKSLSRRYPASLDDV